MKEFLSQNQIAFVERNVEADQGAIAELKAKTGRLAVPVITVDDEVVVGFDLGRLKQLLHL